jgi:hypothetical protein
MSRQNYSTGTLIVNKGKIFLQHFNLENSAKYCLDPNPDLYPELELLQNKLEPE